MKIEFEIPEESRQALLSSRSWEGEVSMSVNPDGESNLIRLAVVEKELESLFIVLVF